MNEILVFGGVECYEVNGTAYLKLETVARGLGFTRIAESGNEVIRWERVEGYLKDLGVPTCGHDDFIPENVFYRLAMKAKNEAAEAFQAKIADEVIPSIRRTGAYFVRKSNETEEKELDAKMFALRNERARILREIAQGYEGTTYKQILDAYATKELAGDFLLPLPRLPERTYSAREVGEMLGISANKVGRIAKAHGLKTEIYGQWFKDKAPHSAKEVNSFRYYQRFVDKAREYL